jgi:thiol:disulfide interchange protein DsbD
MILMNNFVLYFTNLEVYSLNSMMRFITIILLSLNLYSNSNTSDFLIKQNNILSANKAFNIETITSDDSILISWDIKKGYYLYSKSIIIENNYETLSFEVLKSEESIHNDEFFGKSKIYRDKLLIKLNRSIGLDLKDILIKYQGCADVGICYPIQIHKIL